MTTLSPTLAESRVGSGHSRWVIAGLTGRKAVRSGALWGYVFGIVVASSALGYAATYKTQAARDHLAATFGDNSGIDALIGRAHDVQTVAGFTAWRSLGVLGIVGAVWGVLASTRLLRGEEEAGRWELLLAGRTTRRSAAAKGLLGLAAGAGVLYAITAVVAVAIGRSGRVGIDAPSALFLALALVVSAVVFLTVGGLASQLAATRRRAAAYGGVAIGVSFTLRLVADSSASLGWLRWTTPLGWAENLRPLSGSDPVALLPIAGLCAVCVTAALLCAGRRDMGASIVPDRFEAPAHLALLGGTLGLATRLSRASVLGWLASIGGAGLITGFIAKAAGGALTGSASARHALARLGASGTGPRVFLGVTLLMAALLVGLLVSSQVAAIRSSEATGQLDHLLVRPVPRMRWFASGFGLVALGAVLGGVLVGLCAWLGQASQHAGVPFASLVDAGLNVVPPALCVLGVGALAFGVWPRATVVATYSVLVWSFLLDLVGGIVGLNHWLLDTSLFHQIAAAPAETPNWPTNAVMLAVAVVAAVAGAVGFARRDLAGE